LRVLEKSECEQIIGGFMTIPEMMSQSGLLTVLGMGVVFAFLIILIAFMKLVEVLVRMSGLDKEEKTAASTAPAVNRGQDTAIVAAIAAAVSEKQK